MSDAPDVAPGDPRVASLRGAQPAAIGRTPWIWVGAVCLAIALVVVVVSFFSAANDNARLNRLREHGVAVTVTVVDCLGNVGGSGSNGAGYSCHGRYTTHGRTFHEVIADKSTFSAPGSTVAAVADPAKLSSIELASAVRTSHPSSSKFIAPSLIAVLWVVVATLFLRVLQRRRRVSP